MALVKAIRNFGHLAARLDPLGSDPPGDPALDPGPLGLTPEIMARIPAEVLRIYVPGRTLAEAYPRLQETYCGTISYEVEHIGSHQERVWLRQVIESGEHRKPLTADQRRRLLSRLTAVETLERFLHRAYLGQKRFSIEGLDVLVPMLDQLIELAGASGARRVVLGMAHRGRLNVLAHIVGLPYETIFAEFEGGRHVEETLTPEGGTGDVKYHHGADGVYQTAAGKPVNVTLTPNPSHLEAVNPVVEGRARANQTNRRGKDAIHDTTVALPVLIHGDASFAAQGVVAETFNLARLRGYTTGGTIHLIANNQLGFTTDPKDARSTDYASDLAKGFDVPIVHVNADDPEACLAAVRLAMMYRDKFHGDVVIDVVGYRRHGHNEGDEPAYTQPLLYERIKNTPTVRERYMAQLVREGVVERAAADAEAERMYQRLSEVQQSLKAHLREAGAGEEPQRISGAQAPTEPDTAVAAPLLTTLNEQLLAVPEGFTVHPKLQRQLERRRPALAEGAIDWAHAEALAFASLLVEGTPIRLTGQDTERGTFSQRHLVLHDVTDGRRYAPIQHLPGARAPFELHNSPLSEFACLGFEYGYATAAPDALVLWEAQYGDFTNGAEVIIDQFLIAGLAKWGQTSRLTLLLPHGYEGQGPEHSSARVERFLALGAEGNIRIANCTTPAQYFHLLRRQARHAELRPLVLFTPKSLLRLPQAASRLAELTAGRFQPVLDDPAAAGRAEAVRRLILCSGKIYYDLVLAPARAAAAHVAIGRVELLYPFPREELAALVRRYPNVREIVWVQEEPRNMGPQKFMLPQLRDIVPGEIALRAIARPERSSPAEGYPAAHQAEQARIVAAAFAD
jgi:2-oxoglutarate dehydrogenase E1 component